MMRRFLLALFVLFLVNHQSLIINQASAIDSSPSATIKSELEELKKEIASRAAKLKLEINKKLQNKAYIGKITQKSDQSLTLTTRSGPKTVKINQDTEYQSQLKTKSKASLKNLSEDNFVVALGDIDESEVLTAKKMVIIASIPEPKKHLWGQILAISDNLITIKEKDVQNFSLSETQKTDIRVKPKINDFIIATGQFTDKKVLEAGFIYVIPQGSYIKPRGKISTPSATQSSPSATIKPTLQKLKSLY